MVLDDHVKVKISDLDGQQREYKLKFPNTELFAAERELASGKFIILFGGMDPRCPVISLSDLFVLFKYAIQGGKNKLEDGDTVDDLFNRCIAENNGFVGTQSIVLEALSKATPIKAMILEEQSKKAKKAEAR